MAVGPEDRVRILLGGSDVLDIQRYEVSQRFFTVPSAFACRVGSGITIAELAKRYPPGTPYALYVGEVLQHSGKLDGYGPEGSEGASEMNLRGRDAMAPLLGSFTADRSFSDLSYLQLTTAVLDAAGMSPYSITAGNEANRKGQSNDTKVRDLLNYEAAVLARAGLPVFEQTLVVGQQRVLRAKVGDQYLSFLKKEHAHPGLFLLAGADENNFVLTSPNVIQSPTFQLTRQRGASVNLVTVEDAKHQNDTSQRHSRYIVYGRGGGGKDGRQKIRGEFVDQELVDWKIARDWADVSDDAKSNGQAAALAFRRCAEERRQGWSLTYTVQGHTAPLKDAGARRGIWAVDTLVRVHDDEFGLHEDLWLEGVTFRGGPDGTKTELTMLRPRDVAFGDPIP
ncbi:MAG: hypothetical protein WKG00_03315 [Polyangiaceae bacterium]